MSPELEEFIAKIQQTQASVEQEDGTFFRRIEKAEKVGRVVWAIGALVVAITIWVITVQGKLTAIQGELDDRKLDIQHVREMWWMKVNGVSNRADYYDKNGQPAQPRKETP